MAEKTHPELYDPEEDITISLHPGVKSWTSQDLSIVLTTGNPDKNIPARTKITKKAKDLPLYEISVGFMIDKLDIESKKFDPNAAFKYAHEQKAFEQNPEIIVKLADNRSYWVSSDHKRINGDNSRVVSGIELSRMTGQVSAKINISENPTAYKEAVYSIGKGTLIEVDELVVEEPVMWSDKESNTQIKTVHKQFASNLIKSTTRSMSEIIDIIHNNVEVPGVIAILQEEQREAKESKRLERKAIMSACLERLDTLRANMTIYEDEDEGPKRKIA